MVKTYKPKPFIKWAGGKGQLIEQIDKHLPYGFKGIENVTYIEPFIGGGAMLFHMLQTYKNISRVVINDINPDLVKCYMTVRDNPVPLIESLHDIENRFYSFDTEDKRRMFYMDIRNKYNQKKSNPVENTTMFIFLNKTCFNGLHRVNKSGCFNVPFGKCIRPMICDENTIMSDSLILQNVEILNGDFEDTFEYAEGNSLFYFDPPYRPIGNSIYFNDYAKEGFTDVEQIRLKEMCDKINESGFRFMLSNSDGKLDGETENFFDVLYKDYIIDRIYAPRSINSVGTNRGKVSEILVRNYEKTRGCDIVEYQDYTLW